MVIRTFDFEQPEEWRVIPGVGDGYYEVSNLGRVRSYRAHGGKRRAEKPVIRVLRLNCHGYVQVGLQVGAGRQKQFSVHSLVAKAFFGPAPEGKQVAHADGNRQNNNVHNLRYATPAENAADKNLHGTAQRGERNGRAKLTRRQIEEILSERRLGAGLAEIAAMFGVSNQQVSNIVRGAAWSHLGLAWGR